MCDYIWTIELEHTPELVIRCGRGTGIQILPEYTRRVGIRDTGGGSFVMYRNDFRPSAPLGDSENDELEKVGVGAFRGADWTFAGEDTDITAVPGSRYSFFFSGEGSF